MKFSGALVLAILVVGSNAQAEAQLNTAVQVLISNVRSNFANHFLKLQNVLVTNLGQYRTLTSNANNAIQSFVSKQVPGAAALQKRIAVDFPKVNIANIPFWGLVSAGQKLQDSIKDKFTTYINKNVQAASSYPKANACLSTYLPALQTAFDNISSYVALLANAEENKLETSLNNIAAQIGTDRENLFSAIQKACGSDNACTVKYVKKSLSHCSRKI